MPLSTTPAEAPKRQLARYLLNEDDWTVSVQVSQEFVVQVRRATRSDRLDLAAAQQSGCTLVLSEDMSDGETYGTVAVRNPFAVICS